MAILILSWIVVAFVATLFAHGLVPGDRAIDVDVDVTLIMGMTLALVLGASANLACGAPPWGVHPAGFGGVSVGALIGVAAGAFGQRVRRAA